MVGFDTQVVHGVVIETHGVITAFNGRPQALQLQGLEILPRHGFDVAVQNHFCSPFIQSDTESGRRNTVPVKSPTNTSSPVLTSTL